MSWNVSPPPVVYLQSWWVLHQLAAALQVTPTITASATFRVNVQASKTITPTITGSINYHPVKAQASETITPAISSAANLHPGKVHDAMTVTPSLSASATRTTHGSASLTVTPTLTATAAVIHAPTTQKPQQIQVAIPRAATM